MSIGELHYYQRREEKVMQIKKFFEIYMYLPILALLVGSYIVFFAEDKYRYECQNPDFWSAPQCNPPICLATGTCTSDLISLDGNYSNRYEEQVNKFMSLPAEETPSEEAAASEEYTGEVDEIIQTEEASTEEMIDENSSVFELEESPNIVDGINQTIEETNANE
jgi:hypothetical protein